MDTLFLYKNVLCVYLNPLPLLLHERLISIQLAPETKASANYSRP